MSVYAQIVFGTSICALAIFLAIMLLVLRRFIAERRQGRAEAVDHRRGVHDLAVGPIRLAVEAGPLADEVEDV